MADYSQYNNPRFLAFCKAHGITVAQFFDPDEYRNMLPFTLWINSLLPRYFESRKLLLPRSSLDRQIYDQNDWTAFILEVANTDPVKPLER
jgi:hypothetical protein